MPQEGIECGRYERASHRRVHEDEVTVTGGVHLECKSGWMGVMYEYELWVLMKCVLV